MVAANAGRANQMFTTLAIMIPIRPTNKNVPMLVRSRLVVKPSTANVPNTAAAIKNAVIILAPVNTRNILPRLRPCATAKPKNISTMVLVLKRSAPNVMARTNASGLRIINQVRIPPVKRKGMVLAIPAKPALTTSAADMRMNTSVVHELVDANQAHEALKQKQKTVLFVYAPWCGYCKKQKPVLDELAAKHTNIKFLAINAEQAGKPITSAMRIDGFPAFLTNFGRGAQDGKPKMHVGYKDAAAFEQTILNA